jgi:hypothetical protein
MGNLAQTLYAQGDLTEARKLQERVLEGRSRVLGKEHPDTLRAMKNLAQFTGNRDLTDHQNITFWQKLWRLISARAKI